MIKKRLEINTDLGPIPVVMDESIPMNAVLVTSSEHSGRTTFHISWYDDGRHIPVAEIDYQQMIDDWYQYGDYMHTYRKTLDRDDE